MIKMVKELETWQLKEEKFFSREKIVWGRQWAGQGLWGSFKGELMALFKYLAVLKKNEILPDGQGPN